jgi:hypothetical protein
MSPNRISGWFAGLRGQENETSGTHANHPPPVESAPAPRDGAPETLVIDSDNGWAVGTAADLTETEADPVHDVLKRTDVWFSYRVNDLEREARELAAAHAEKGQPRHDLRREGPLEMETLLEKHGSEILSGWMDRVRRKMQGAVEGETERIGTGVAAARRSVAQAEAAAAAFDAERKDASRIVQAFRVVGPDGESGEARKAELGGEVVHCERHVPTWAFVLLSAILIFADFLANLPVFVELFPADRLLDAAMVRWEQQQLAQGLTASYGFRHLFARAAAYPESSILALSVIIFFLVLGHHAGSLLRTLVALWSHRTRMVSRAGAARWRQSLWPAALSAAGIAGVVFVLYAARDGVRPMAQERYDAALRQQAQADQLLAASRNDPAADINALVSARTRASREVTARQERLDYASTLAEMNRSITILNIVLVLAAIVLGYLHREERISVEPEAASDRLEQMRKRAQAMREQFDRRWAELIARRSDAHEAMRAVEIAIHRADHLLDARVLTDAPGKAERIRRAIPLFRMENARQRGLDVEDILAFREPVRMTLPAVGADRVVLARPVALERYRAEFDALQRRLHTLDQELPHGRPELPEFSFAHQEDAR